MSRERAGRAARRVTVVRGLALDADALAALGKRLRAACGAGRRGQDGVLEIQGDHVERVLALLLLRATRGQAHRRLKARCLHPLTIIRDGLRAGRS